jgi:nucleoid-associated protein YgaU
LSKYIKSDDPEALQEAYESIGLALIPEKPYPTIKGIQIILREMGAKDPAARSARPEQFVDLSIIKELDSSGFIDRLYKSAPVTTALPQSAEPVASSAPTKPQVAELKTKPMGSEEKPRLAAKQVPLGMDKAQASLQTSRSSGSQPYTVKAGDTLSKLAGQFYNAPDKWERIYEANRDQLKNPNYIYIGQKLMIPSDDKTS